MKKSHNLSKIIQKSHNLQREQKSRKPFKQVFTFDSGKSYFQIWLMTRVINQMTHVMTRVQKN